MHLQQYEVYFFFVIHNSVSINQPLHMRKIWQG